MFKLIIFGTFLALCHGSLFCPHSVVPSSKDAFRTMIMQVKERDGQQPMYRIVDNEITDLSFKSASKKFKLLTRMDNSECPGRSCVTELSAAMPRHQGSILYLTNIVGKLIPPGFTTIEVKNRLYCAIIEGDCGATIPIYRYFKFTMGGLYHAYATDNVDISGFTIENPPLCYGWPVQEQYDENIPNKKKINVNLTPNEKSEIKNENLQMITLDCSSKSKKSSRDSMKPLNVWKNDKNGPFTDHWYTTKKPSTDYQYDDTIGLVVVDEKKSNCGCLVRLTQMVDDKPDGLWARTDHKLVIDYKEPLPIAGEEYTNIEEEIFCVKEEGVCGATVPLRKYFKLGDMDTVYTVNDATIPPFAIPTPSGVLCYIWPAGKNDLPTASERNVEGMKNEEKSEKKISEEKSKPQTLEEMKKEESEQDMKMKPIKDSKSKKSEVKEEKPAKKSESEKKSEVKEDSEKSESKKLEIKEEKPVEKSESEKKSEGKNDKISEKSESQKSESKQEKPAEKSESEKKSEVKEDSEKSESKKEKPVEKSEPKKSEVEKKKVSKKDEEKKTKKVEKVSATTSKSVTTEAPKISSKSTTTIKVEETTPKIAEISSTEKVTSKIPEPTVSSTESTTVESTTKKSEEKSATEKIVEKITEKVTTKIESTTKSETESTTEKTDENSTKKVEESTSSSAEPSTNASTESSTTSSTEPSVVSSTEPKISSINSKSSTETMKKE